jgi:general secretion pathway protein D
MVTLKIKQEVSDAVKTTSSDIDSPTIQSRVVETSLVVEDGTTIMLGGMIRTRDVKSESGFPLLKDIPGLGALFRNRGSENQRQELLLLMTVNVVEMNSDVERLARRYKAAIEEIKAKLDQDAEYKYE